MPTNRPKTKILVDGGDPNETLRIKSLLGFVDGQTTNPSLIAKNPEIQRLIASGHSLSSEEEKNCSQRSLHLCMVSSLVSPMRSPGHSRLDAPIIAGEDVGL